MRNSRRRRAWMSAGVPLALVLAAGCSDDGNDAEATAVEVASTPTDAASAPETTSAPTPAEPTTSADESDDESATAALELAIDELVAMPGGPPGVVAVVQVGDERTVHVGGVADVETGTEPTADDHMRVASVAKAFSGATALALVDEGVLSLDDTISERLPDLPAAWGEVTLRQLLSHTSGVPDFVRTEGFAVAVTGSLDVPLPPEELLTFAADLPLDFEPGTQYVYSNSDNITVGLMIQAATGEDYADVLAAKVLEPLGLDATSLPVGVEVPTPLLHGYDLEDGTAEDVTELMAAGWAWASGGVVSTPADLNDFIRGYVSGALYSDETRAEQQTLFIPGGESGPPGPGQNSASLALYRYDTPCGTVYGHTGNTLGYTQFAAATPDGDRSVTVSISLQRTDTSEGQALAVFHALDRVRHAAVCAALED